jgi:hypothetical protein
VGASEKFKIRSGSYSGLALSMYVKKQNENLAGLSLLRDRITRLHVLKGGMFGEA